MNWQNVAIKDVCLLAVDCINKTAPVVDYETPYKMLRTTNVRGGFVDAENVRYVTEETYTQWTRRSKPMIGDVLLTREAPLGDVGRVTVDDNLFLGQRLFQYRANPEKLDAKFLAYVLQSPVVQGRIQSKGFGATVQHAKVGEFENLEIPFPPLDVQIKIGDILASYDDLIENNRRRIQLLEESARLLYKEWFVHLRFPGHEHVKVVDGVPDGWKRTIASEIIAINPQTKVEKNKEIWYVPMAALSETDMTVNTSHFERRTQHTNVKFTKNDVLLARITPCLENGKTGFASFLDEGEIACGSTEFIVLRGERVSPAFTYCLARSYPFRENAIKSMIGSSGRQRVQSSCFDKYIVPLPPESLLMSFDEVANKNFAQVKVLMEQNKKLGQARDLLLPKLMSGEIAV